jgi:hypothetical protein
VTVNSISLAGNVAGSGAAAKEGFRLRYEVRKRFWNLLYSFIHIHIVIYATSVGRYEQKWHQNTLVAVGPEMRHSRRDYLVKSVTLADRQGKVGYRE